MKLKYYLRGLGIGIFLTSIILMISFNARGSRTMSDSEIRARAAQLGMVDESEVLIKSAGSSSSRNTQQALSDNEVPDDGLAYDEEDMAGAGDEISLSYDEVSSSYNSSPSPSANGSEDTALVDVASGSSSLKDNDGGALSSESDTSGSSSEPSSSSSAVNSSSSEQTSSSSASQSSSASSSSSSALTSSSSAVASQSSSAVSSSSSSQKSSSASPRAKVAGSVQIRTGDSSYTVANKLANSGVIDSARQLDSFLTRYGYDRRLTTGDHKIPAGASFDEIGRILTTKVK